MLRHRKIIKKARISKADLRRLARRGGIMRLSDDAVHQSELELRRFLTRIVRDATEYTEHARRKTVTAMDVVHALKRYGNTLYQ